MTTLRFPAEIAVGEVEWEDPREPNGWDHLLAIGVLEVPDQTAVRLRVYTVAEVSVSGHALGFAPISPRRPQEQERVTWERGMPDSALRNERSIWGGPGESWSVESGDEAVDLAFIRDLPADSVFDLSLTSDIVAGSFAAVAHLAPGLRDLSVYLDSLADDAPSVIAQLTALESLTLGGGPAAEDGPGRLDDHALSAIACLPALEYLSLMHGAYTEHGLRQLSSLRKLRHLHIEREDLTSAMFQFAYGMPTLTRLSGLDEFGDDGPMPPAEVNQVRAMLPHIIVG